MFGTGTSTASSNTTIGHFLNPEFFYDNPSMEFDGELIRGLYEVINLEGDQEMEKIIMGELLFYKMGAAQWWQMYGSDTLHLQQIATRILNLTCSASGCECNWSVFEKIHSKRRNRLEHKRLHDLVYVKYNQAPHRRYNLRDKIDPISLNEIDECDEWLLGEMDGDGDGEDRVFEEEDDDLNWRHVYNALDLGKPIYSRRKRKQRTRGAGQEGTSQRSSKRCKGGASSTRKGKMVQVEEALEDNSSEEEELEADLSEEEAAGFAPLENVEIDYVGLEEGDEDENDDY
ncbi:hypothetical protein HKD37_20G055506 [Glycine soja]|nr:hypothetical protein GmHk_20G056872 [Glycine max]